MSNITDLPLELTYDILLYESYDDIMKYCLVNKAASEICHDTIFWMKKLDYEYQDLGFKPSIYITKYKHPDMKGTDIYRRWKSVKLSSNIEDKIRNEYNDMVFWIMDHYDAYLAGALYVYIANIAAKYYNHEILVYFASKGIFPSRAGATNAAGNGHLKVLQWLFTMGIYPDDQVVEKAAGGGYLDILIWLNDNDYKMTKLAAIYAVVSGQREIVEWLTSKGIYPDMNLYYYPYPDGKDEKTILKGLNMAYSIGVVPITWSVVPNMAARDGYINILEWFKRRGILPDQRGINYAMGNGKMLTVDWITRETGLVPNDEAVNYAITYGNLWVLELLYRDYNFLPNNQSSINWDAASNGYLDILIWLDNLGIHPSTNITISTINRFDFDTFSWFEQHGIVYHILNYINNNI